MTPPAVEIDAGRDEVDPSAEFLLVLSVEDRPAQRDRVRSLVASTFAPRDAVVVSVSEVSDATALLAQLSFDLVIGAFVGHADARVQDVAHPPHQEVTVPMADDARLRALIPRILSDDDDRPRSAAQILVWRGSYGAPRDRASVSPDRPLRASIADLILKRRRDRPIRT